MSTRTQQVFEIGDYLRNTVQVRDRLLLGPLGPRRNKRVFLACEAVAKLLDGQLAASEREAVAIGQELLESGVIYPVKTSSDFFDSDEIDLDSAVFANDKTPYRFTVDDSLVNTFEDGVIAYVAPGKGKSRKIESKANGGSLEWVITEEMLDKVRNKVEVKDRRYHLRVYKKCFLGMDLVDVLVQEGLVRNKGEGLLMGQAMLDRGEVFHVVDNPEFIENNFYRFTPPSSQK